MSREVPRGLVVRIRRSHRRGPGSIPGVGIIFSAGFHMTSLNSNYKTIDPPDILL